MNTLDGRLSYIGRKIAHMQRMGIPAGIGEYGGACPTWLKELREDERKRAWRRRNIADRIFRSEA